jgi:hypothetical protein
MCYCEHLCLKNNMHISLSHCEVPTAKRLDYLCALNLQVKQLFQNWLTRFRACLSIKVKSVFACHYPVNFSSTNFVWVWFYFPVYRLSTCLPAFISSHCHERGMEGKGETDEDMYKLFPEMQLLRVGHINTNYTQARSHDLRVPAIEIYELCRSGVHLCVQGSMLWSQFSAIFDNFWRKNWRFSQKPLLWSNFCII